MSQKPTEGSLKKLQDHLQFTFVLVLFFPTILTAVLSSSPQAEIGKNISMYGLVILCLIVMYLFLELAKDHMALWMIKLCDALLLIQIAAFVPVFYVIAAVQRETVPSLLVLPFGVSLVAILLIPLAIITVLTGYTLLLEIRFGISILRKLLGIFKNRRNKM